MFILGSELTMLDLYIWPWFERLPAFFPDSEMVPKEKFPKLSAWVEHMWQTDAVKATGKSDSVIHICKLMSRSRLDFYMPFNY